MATFAFDPSTVEKRSNSFDLLPAGNYVAQITDTEIVDLKSGNGTALKMTVTVLQEGYNGRKIFCRLNIRHTNPKAQEIAQQQLRELCEAIGLARLSDTTELHNKPFIARVKIRKDDTGQYEPQNEISGFRPLGSTSAPPAFSHVPAPIPAGAMQAANAGGTPPWQKRAA